ncbi:MAG: copper-binding protein [Gemmatimonadaceae bacterium]|nr:copper-binding protein [Acetobacteraceae bacterium]
MLQQWTVALVALVAATGVARAEGDLGVRGTRMELVIGTGESGFGVSQKNFELTTGKLYQLKIKATGAKECAWEAPQLAATVWLRKVEAGNVEIKAPTLTELEFERESEAEIFFVPIRTGNFPWRCRGMEAQGMAGAFLIK